MALAATAAPGVEVTVPLHGGLNLPMDDQGLATRILKKRQEEMARRSRLLDPRNRRGVDHSILGAQVAEKRAVQEAAAAEEAEAVRHQKLQREILTSVEEFKLNAARERHKALLEYSNTHLKKESRREYALSDPNALRNELPPGANGEPLGPSSMVVFKGSDEFQERRKQLAAVQAESILLQKQENQDRREEERQLQEQHDRDLLMANSVLLSIEQQDKKEARQEKCEEAEENIQLAKVHKARRAERKKMEAEAEARHVDNTLNDDRLNETYDYRLGQDGRVAKNDFKRMTVEEEQDVLDTRAQQILEKQFQKQTEIEEEEQYAHGVLMGVSVLGELEREKERQRKERLKKMVAHNQSLAAAKRESDLQERRQYRSYDP